MPDQLDLLLKITPTAAAISAFQSSAQKIYIYLYLMQSLDPTDKKIAENLCIASVLGEKILGTPRHLLMDIREAASFIGPNNFKNFIAQNPELEPDKDKIKDALLEIIKKFFKKNARVNLQIDKKRAQTTIQARMLFYAQDKRVFQELKTCFSANAKALASITLLHESLKKFFKTPKLFVQSIEFKQLLNQRLQEREKKENTQTFQSRQQEVFNNFPSIKTSYTINQYVTFIIPVLSTILGAIDFFDIYNTVSDVQPYITGAQILLPLLIVYWLVAFISFFYVMSLELYTQRNFIPSPNFTSDLNSFIRSYNYKENNSEEKNETSKQSEQKNNTTKKSKQLESSSEIVKVSEQLELESDITEASKLLEPESGELEISKSSESSESLELRGETSEPLPPLELQNDTIETPKQLELPNSTIETSKQFDLPSDAAETSKQLELKTETIKQSLEKTNNSSSSSQVIISDTSLKSANTLKERKSNNSKGKGKNNITTPVVQETTLKVNKALQVVEWDLKREGLYTPIPLQYKNNMKHIEAKRGLSDTYFLYCRCKNAKLQQNVLDSIFNHPRTVAEKGTNKFGVKIHPNKSATLKFKHRQRIDCEPIPAKTADGQAAIIEIPGALRYK